MGNQLSFADAFVDPRLGANQRLTKIDGLIDWSALLPLLAGLRDAATGRPPYAALSMLKALYLQGLSICPIRGWKRRCSIACPSAASAALPSMTRPPTRPPSAASGRPPPTRARCRRASAK